MGEGHTDSNARAGTAREGAWGDSEVAAWENWKAWALAKGMEAT